MWHLAPNFPQYTNFDPEVNSFGSTAVQGIELSAAPTTRRFGFNMNVIFLIIKLNLNTMLHKIKLLIPLVGLLAVSCKKFLDINTDPNNPTTIEVSKLLPTTQRTLGDALSMDEKNGGLSEVLAVYTHQMTTREEADKYGITGIDGNIQTAWSKLFSSTANPGTAFPVYGVLQNLEDIIAKSTAAGNLQLCRYC